MRPADKLFEEWFNETYGPTEVDPEDWRELCDEEEMRIAFVAGFWEATERMSKVIEALKNDAAGV